MIAESPFKIWAVDITVPKEVGWVILSLSCFFLGLLPSNPFIKTGYSALPSPYVRRGTDRHGKHFADRCLSLKSLTKLVKYGRSNFSIVASIPYLKDGCFDLEKNVNICKKAKAFN